MVLKVRSTCELLSGEYEELVKLAMKMPPPDFAALPETVQLVSVRVLPAIVLLDKLLLKMPPPKEAVLPETVLLVSVSLPASLAMPPPTPPFQG